jgi:Outer membrane protein beta-barrel domain
MRALFVLLALLLTAVPASFAQLGFGPEVGIGMSSMHFAPELGFTSASTTAILSGKIGGTIDVHLNKKLSFQSGLFLSRKGQTRDFSFYSSDSLNEYVHQTLTINYIDVPVNVLYKTGVQGKGRAFFGIGITPSYIIGGRNKLKADGVSNDTAYHTTIDREIANGKPVGMFDIGVNLTGGYELPTGLFFRIYYTAGMKDIGLGREIDKNRMWGVSAGYLFGKGRNINKEADDLIDHSTD